MPLLLPLLLMLLKLLLVPLLAALAWPGLPWSWLLWSWLPLLVLLLLLVLLSFPGLVLWLVLVLPELLRRLELELGPGLGPPCRRARCLTLSRPPRRGVRGSRP
ncbi:MAG: hypothetical protein VKJ44_06295 [Synechococcus sp.]|nr:hypothetical protein [Synechococcus sp.]